MTIAFTITREIFIEVHAVEAFTAMVAATALVFGIFFFAISANERFVDDFEMSHGLTISYCGKALNMLKCWEIKTKTMKRISIILISGIVALALSLGYGAYMFFDGKAKSEQLSNAEALLEDFVREDLKVKNGEVLAAITAKKTVNELSGGLIKWSEVISEVIATIPKTRTDALIDVTSYSGGNDRVVTINVRTLAGRDNPYFDVAQLIESFDESELFVSTFVPSITAGQNAEGSEVLNFNLSTKYSPKAK